MSLHDNDEKGTIVAPHPQRRSFFSRQKLSAEQEKQHTPADLQDVDQKDNPSPASFVSMFQFSTKFELFLDAIGLLAAAAAGAAQPLMSLLFGNLTQEFVAFGLSLESNDPSSIATSAAHFRSQAAKDASYLVYIGIGTLFCTYVYIYVWVYTGEVNAKRIRERYLQSILRQDIAFFDKVGAGEIATRIQTDTHLVQQGISEKVALVMNFLAAFLTGFVLAYARSWRLALAQSSILPCIILTGSIMNRFISRYMQLSLKNMADGGTLAEEVISTIRTAQAFGTQKTLSSLYDQYVGRAHVADFGAAFWHGAGMGGFFFIIYAGYALAFSFGTTLINRGEATAGDVVNVFLAILIGSFSLFLLGPEMQAITHGRAAAAKLFATINRVPDIDSANPDGLKPEKVIGELTLEDVKFSYPARPNMMVAKGVSITFPAGKSGALVGASGSGKSTIISLVERFYDPTSGVIKLDGVDLKDLNLKWLRSQIGLVSQEPTLFATTIRENVAYGLIGTKHEHASDEEKFALIKEACIKANADGFITKLPNGYDTMVGERGFLLSGGQKQRVAIARAIVSDPRILLLDEATSALDTRSEGIVQDALDKATAGRTTITIAHRLSTIKDADCIYVMGDGLVLEQGTHGELLNDENGHYTRLVQSQKLRERQQSNDPDNADAETVADEDVDDIHKLKAEEDVPLGRKNTEHSLASDIIEKRRDTGSAHGKDHSLTYVFMRMGEINRENWPQYLFGVIFASMTGMVYPAFGIVFALAIRAFSSTDAHVRRIEGDRDALWLFIIAIISAFAIYMQSYLFASAAATLVGKLRSLSFKAIMRQDIEFFDNDANTTGSLTTNLSENPQKVNGLAGITLGTIIQSISTIITGSIVGLVFQWKLALVAIACIPLVVSTGYVRLRVVVLKDQANKSAHEDSAHLACEAAGSIRTVAALKREESCLEQYRKSLEGPLKTSNRSSLWSSALYAITQSMTFYVIGLIFWYGSILVASQEISTFQFFVCLMSTTFGAMQAGNVFAFVPDISSARSAGSDIINLLDSVPGIDAESSEGKQIDVDKVRGHVRLDNVHFRYPSRPGVRVLRGLSLQVEPGTYIALVGASGSGKSTVIQLIERFYDPLAGEIYLDGERISDLNIQEYRKQIALVSQEPTLYSGTLRFNILLGAIKPHSEVTQEEIELACRNANILDFINSLPDGFETEVGGKGSQLSGGQKQRIAIARALLRNPKVLLLDEATSALDSNSEKVVQEALDQAAKGRTTVAIAHRLSTIQNAHRIYFVKEGVISESGNHDHLLSLRGDYYEYVQLQALSKRD